jgi:5-methyltetrahydropteroyltriglutamate--homocysteine methyltransferase
VKVPITGPYTLARWSFNEVYESEATLAYDLADLVNEEIRALVDAGARYIQIDEPALATTPDDHSIVGECLDRITAGVPDDVRLGLHVCYGDYSRIYPEVLGFPVDELDIELCNGGYDQLDVFGDPPFTKDLGLGVVDVHDADVESVAEIKQNIERGLEIVPPDRLTVSPGSSGSKTRVNSGRRPTRRYRSRRCRRGSSSSAEPSSTRVSHSSTATAPGVSLS